MFQLIVMPQGIEKVMIKLIDTPTKVYSIGAWLFLSKVPLKVLQNWVLVNVNAEDLRRRLRVFRPSYFAEGFPKPSETKEIVENTAKIETFLPYLANSFHFYCYFKH